MAAQRLVEARQAGLTNLEARLFAYGDYDVGELRKLVAAGADSLMIARIVL